MTAVAVALPCVACGIPLVPHGTRDVPDGHRRHQARRLCHRCWWTAYRDGHLADYPPCSRSRDDLLADWALVRARTRSLAEAAALLGMTKPALERALGRARRDGDPRAMPTATR